MDKHSQVIHELCDKYYHGIISDDIRDEIIHHLIRTKYTKSVTEEIVNRLSVESRIKILADLMLLADLMNEGITTPADEVILSLIVFRDKDRTLGSYIEKRLSPAQKQRVISFLSHELNVVRRNLDENLSREETEEQLKRLTDKSIYSYQTLLELTIFGRRAKMNNEVQIVNVTERMVKLVKITIDAFNLYRS